MGHRVPLNQIHRLLNTRFHLSIFSRCCRPICRWKSTGWFDKGVFPCTFFFKQSRRPLENQCILPWKDSALWVHYHIQINNMPHYKKKGQWSKWFQCCSWSTGENKKEQMILCLRQQSPQWLWPNNIRKLYSTWSYYVWLIQLSRVIFMPKANNSGLGPSFKSYHGRNRPMGNIAYYV